MAPRKTQTPHKNHHLQNQSRTLQQVQASDYDSEAPYNQFSSAPAFPTTRTNEELNLSVLRRYVPSISTVRSYASTTDLYTYSLASESWERAEISGTLFVCQLQSIGTRERYCVVVLNKKGLDNLIIDVANMQNVEITSEFLIVRFTDKGQERVLGFFIHPDQDAREVNSEMIKRCWEEVMEGNNGAQDLADPHTSHMGNAQEGPVAGQSIDVMDLFRRQGMR